MKLRIKGNSLRFRLTKRDLERLSGDGVLREALRFAGRELAYQLRSSSCADDVSATFNDGCIDVAVPRDFLTEWANTDAIGIRAAFDPDRLKGPRVLIEKEFGCGSLSDDIRASDRFDDPRRSAKC